MATSSSALRFALSYRSFINTNGGNPFSGRRHIGRHVTGFLMVAVLALASTRAQAVLIYATSGNDIARFDSGATGVVTSVPVTGLQAGESLVGIDTRPATQTLYGGGRSGPLYTINPPTPAATPVRPRGRGTVQRTRLA